MSTLVPRIALVALAAVAVTGALLLDGAASSGNWTVASTYRGVTTPDAPDAHALDVALPATWEADGLRVAAARAELSLRATGALDADAYRVTVEDAQGRVALDARVDPANPFSLPHGPPSTVVGPGAYTVRVLPLGDEPTEYAFSAALVLPFSVGARGLVVPSLLPWGVAVVALVGALFPIPRFARGGTEVIPE